MNFTAKETMYHGNRGLIQAGESINFSEEEIKEFEPDYFKQLFSGNEDEVAKIFNPKSKAKDKEPGTETEPGDKTPPDENKKCIVSDVPLAFIDYIYDVTDLDVWDSISLYMLQCKLASALAMPLTGDRGLFDQAYKLYQAAVQEAKGMNAKERKQDTVYISNYVKARAW